MSARVSVDDLATAREWLLANEGEHGEAESCLRVADWISTEMLARELRSVARGAGVSMSLARSAFAKAQGDTS